MRCVCVRVSTHERIYARGGAAVSLKAVTGCPILFVGVGEKLEDLEAGVARVRFPGGRFWVGFAGQGTLEVERSIHCPEFGVKLENRALVFSTVCDGGDIESAFCITTRSGDDARTLSQSLLLS